MTSTLLSIFLLFIPGVVATEISFLNLKLERKFNFNYLVSIFIYSYIIIACMALVKTLSGGGDQIFLVVAELAYTAYLFKYIVLSILFAVLLPFLSPVFVYVYSKWINRFHA